MSHKYLDAEPCGAECCAETVAEHDAAALAAAVVAVAIAMEWHWAELPDRSAVALAGRRGGWGESVAPIAFEAWRLVDATLLVLVASELYWCADRLEEFRELVAELRHQWALIGQKCWATAP